ncbi:hypothetical protein L211DRAFT_243864 [Terfezia boudieri ATCC MYA-4762]|uniref:Fungal-type protein kinase domain-containing protein n=1 Tax=Terfezia boudieri ATCC MYA-4762 TaxID=1051890 RepID=A0A3N4M4R6_9PEZI|nr:hypothetical protein L211DRAFT_243864 [Terfezia boudieri ATCC MYA-4762]
MGDELQQKKGKIKCKMSYSNVTIAEAEKRLGLRLDLLDEIPVGEMLGTAASEKREGALEAEKFKGVKEEVYRLLVRYLQIEEKPAEADADFEEDNINHLIFSILSPIVEDVMLKNDRPNLPLRTQKEIVSKYGETGRTEEIAVKDRITYSEQKFILIVETERSSLGEALKQCLLGLKDMGDNNGDGSKVYGFITTGETWQMIEYDGISFRLTEEMFVLFTRMDRDKKRWMREFSVVVDCIYFALSHGGIVAKDLVVR